MCFESGKEEMPAQAYVEEKPKWGWFRKFKNPLKNDPRVLVGKEAQMKGVCPDRAVGGIK